jgi:hypothetical protein
MDRASSNGHADLVGGLAYGIRAVGQKRSNVKGPESKKVRNMCGPSFLISVELRWNAVKRSHLGAASDAFDRSVPFRRAHLAPLVVMARVHA